MPDIGDSEYPEFELGLVAKQADALLAKLRANEAIADYFNAGGGITDFESELLLDVEGRLSLRAPFLGVALGPFSRPVVGSGGMVEESVSFDLWIITAMPVAKSTQRWLRSRLVTAISLLLASDEGVLYDVDEPSQPLTDALTVLERVDFRGRLQGTNLIATLLRATYRSDVDRASGEFLN